MTGHRHAADEEQPRIVTSGGLTSLPAGDSKLRADPSYTGRLLWTSPASAAPSAAAIPCTRWAAVRDVLVAVFGDTPPAGQWPAQEGVTPPTGFISFALFQATSGAESRRPTFRLISFVQPEDLLYVLMMFGSPWC